MPMLSVAVATATTILRAIFIDLHLWLHSDPTVGPVIQVWAMTGGPRTETVPQISALQHPANCNHSYPILGVRTAPTPLGGHARGGSGSWRRRRDLNPRWGCSPKPA